MKTKKFLMTSLLVMGMIIAKAANGFPPELVLVSQPVLTYNANSVTVYYDVQNIGDYTYRGNVYVYLDPDDGYYYAKKRVRVCPGRIKRIAVSIPAYRPNPSWVYTVMPYYELGNELYSFTTFEYFEPVRFCWHGRRDEPWVVIHIGPKPRYYHRPGPYRYYYDGYYPILPPPPGGYPPGYYDGMRPLNPMHHTYTYHHNNGGYPANHHPDHELPGYNPADNNNTVPKASVRRNDSNTPGSMSSTESNVNTNTNNSHSMSGSSNSGNKPTSTGRNDSNTGRTGTSSSSSSSNSGSGRVSSSSSSSNSSSSGRTGNSSNSSSSNSNSGRVNNGSNSSSSGRTGNSSGSSRVSGSDSGRTNSSGTSSSSGRSGSSSGSSSSGRSGNSSNSGRSGNSSSGSSGSRTTNSSSGRR